MAFHFSKTITDEIGKERKKYYRKYYNAWYFIILYPIVIIDMLLLMYRLFEWIITGASMIEDIEYMSIEIYTIIVIFGCFSIAFIYPTFITNCIKVVKNHD